MESHLEHIYIMEPQTDNLQFVIAGYDGHMVYHEYSAEKDRLSAGKNISIETARSIFKFINDQVDEIDQTYTFRDLIPSNVLRYSTDERYIAWHTPAQEKKLLFKIDKVGIKDGNYWVPDMLWILNNSGLTVLALAKKPDSLDEKVYNPPFFNVAVTGSVCMGDAKFKTKSAYYDDVMAKVEHAFWNSYFTHSSYNELLSVNYTEFMKEICNGNFNKNFQKRYGKLLVEQKRTIKDILK